MQTDLNNISAQQSERIRRIENGLPPISLGKNEPSLQLTLPNLMELFHIPGLSIAVIDNFEIEWAKGYGVIEAGSAAPVTPRTLFQAGSVSKPVAAVCALSLVEQGRLSLDDDINQKLRTWKVPENEFTVEQKVTLRRLLSHSAGLTVHFFPGYHAGEPIPTLAQILDGESPANTAPIRVDIVPGTKWRYSGGGILVAQQAMIDVTGLPFPQIMREAVFDKLGMDDSTFKQPLPAERTKQAASGTHWNGKTVEGKWHVYPEMAAAGLWTTPSDLARLAIEVALSKQGKSNRVLSQHMAREVLTPQMEQLSELALGNEKHQDRMGLGFFLGDEARPNLFGHIGDDAGFQAMLVMYGDSGKGAAIMANSEVGILLGDYLIENIAQEYGWKDHVSPDRPRLGPPAVIIAVAQSKGIQAAIEQYYALTQTNSSQYLPDRNTLLIFSYSLLAVNQLEDALEVMKLEVQEYPKFWNAYDSLAEIYAAAGETQLAIQNYEKSVELKPDNQHAIEALKKLKEQE